MDDRSVCDLVFGFGSLDSCSRMFFFFLWACSRLGLLIVFVLLGACVCGFGLLVFGGDWILYAWVLYCLCLGRIGNFEI